MAENEVVEKKEWTTALSEWSKTVTNLVSRDFESVGVQFDDYSKKCAMNAVSAIYQLVKNSGTEMAKIDTSNLRDIVTRCASLKLNANSMPREVYFQLRNKKIGDSWAKEVEMGIEGDGNDALMRNWGTGVDSVYPVWIVKEGDYFQYPHRKGLEMAPPEWEEKGLSQKCVRIVYPVKMKDGTVQYLIAEREGVRVNLIAHVRNNLMNETFGLVKGGRKTRYDATDAEKEKINEKKEEIISALRDCETVDDMLKCEIARPYISAAWLDSSESMIIRKMRNNATRQITKDFNSMAAQSWIASDEVYKSSQEEIEARANQTEYVVESDVIEDCT